MYVSGKYTGIRVDIILDVVIHGNETLVVPRYRSINVERSLDLCCIEVKIYIGSRRTRGDKLEGSRG